MKKSLSQTCHNCDYQCHKYDGGWDDCKPEYVEYAKDCPQFYPIKLKTLNYTCKVR